MRIAVIGAGIAGLATANFLACAGIDFAMYEQAEELREVGAGIQITPNASRLLHLLGLADHYEATAVRAAALETRLGKDNRLLDRVPLADGFGAPHYTLHRADLQRGLLSALPAGTLHVGYRCTSVKQDGGRVRVDFDGQPSVEADLVIAADGVHSVIRASIVTDEPLFSGHTLYRGLVPAERLPALTAEPVVVCWLGPGRHCVCYPVSGGRLVSFSAVVPASGWVSESWSLAGDPQALVAAYAGWTDALLDVLTGADRISQWALYDREFSESWHQGRVVLIGDAAHPLLPFMSQGANQAIEDAVVLVNCLRLCPDTEAALHRYEALRQPRMRIIHEVSRRKVQAMHSVGFSPSDAAPAAVDRVGAEEQIAWLFSHDADATSWEG